MNNEQVYEYRIADFIWQCRTSLPLTFNQGGHEFFRQLEAAEVEKIRDGGKIVVFEKTDRLNPVPQNAFLVEGSYFAAEGPDKVVYRCQGGDNHPVAEVHFQPDGNIRYMFLEENVPKLKYTSQWVNALNLEYLMLSQSAFLLHSCLVRYQDEVILFSAPSGTGKSTQGDLWEKYRGADVLNGDRAGIYQKNGQWRATGLPYAGSSGIYRNENAPIRAIVYLAQGPENVISKLNAGQAFRLLYPQINVHHWEPDFVAKVSDLLIALLNDIPVYYFSCTPDERAVEALEKQLSL